MAEYVSLYEPGMQVPVTLSAAAVGGQVIVVTASGTGGPSTGAGRAIGVADFDGGVGDRITMTGRGRIHRTTASGTITAADALEPAAGGLVATHTVGTNDANVVGVALTSATAGNPVEWMEV